MIVSAVVFSDHCQSVETNSFLFFVFFNLSQPIKSRSGKYIYYVSFISKTDIIELKN